MTAELGREEYSKAANTVLHSTYVDVIVDSVTSVTEAVELSCDIDALLKIASFYLKGWSVLSHESSNFDEVLREYSIPSIVDKKSCIAGMTFNSSTTSEIIETQKVLGNALVFQQRLILVYCYTEFYFSKT